MKTIECPGCGNIMTENEPSCKYCGNANPNYVAPKSTFGGRLFSQETTSSPASTSTTSPVAQTEGGSFFLGLILGLFLNWVGVLIAAVAIRKKKSTIGSIVGFCSIIVLGIIIYAIIFATAIRY